MLGDKAIEDAHDATTWWRGINLGHQPRAGQLIFYREDAEATLSSTSDMKSNTQMSFGRSAAFIGAGVPNARLRPRRRRVT